MIDKQWKRGVEAAAALAGEFDGCSSHRYRLEDVILCKLNVSSRKKPRENKARKIQPIPLLLVCPGVDPADPTRVCGARHIDVGEFATRVHHTHACQRCGHTWRPAVVPTVGVLFLPGFKNEEPEGAELAEEFVACEACATKRLTQAHPALCLRCLGRRAAIQAAGRAQAETTAREAVVAAAQELATQGLLDCRRTTPCAERLKTRGSVELCARCILGEAVDELDKVAIDKVARR